MTAQEMAIIDAMQEEVIKSKSKPITVSVDMDRIYEYKSLSETVAYDLENLCS